LSLDTVEPRALDLSARANSLRASFDICIQKYSSLRVKRGEIFVA
jgi:hypothetical protein